MLARISRRIVNRATRGRCRNQLLNEECDIIDRQGHAID
jgi:hypothetical protein